MSDSTAEEPEETTAPSSSPSASASDARASDDRPNEPVAEDDGERAVTDRGDAARADAEDSGERQESQTARDRVRQFPQAPGVYLFKDSAGRVIYVGKATNLRSRAGSYFLKGASEELRTSGWVGEIADADFIACDSEVDALLVESRLIKDIQPKHNKELKDDKTFPYLMITTREDFPRVEVTREPRQHGVKLYGPFASAGGLRGAVQVLQRIFKFRTCSLDIEQNDERWKWFRPCLLASINQCTAPCNFRIDQEDYRRDIRRLQLFLEGRKRTVLKQMHSEMQSASAALQYERAARLRDDIRMLETLDQRGELDTHVQPEVFHIDPKKGLNGLRQVLKLSQTPRSIEGVDIAHLQGRQTVASLVQFLDGMPFKPGYRHYKIRAVEGNDDYQSIHEVISRRYRRLANESDVFPDIVLIDGGKGQLRAALSAFREQEITPPVVLSLAKRNEEIYLPGKSEPLRLSRHAYALRLLQYVRDEAHRFAQHYHHILRKKSTLDDSLASRKKRR